MANHALMEGVEGVVQPPACHAEEIASLQETVRESDTPIAAARERHLALVPHVLHQRTYKKRTDMAWEVVQQLAQEGRLPLAYYAFDHGGLTVELPRYIEGVGTHWGRERESSRPIQWQGQGRRVDAIAESLRQVHPESFRAVQVRCRHGETQRSWAFTQVVRRKRYGRKRLVIGHETAQRTEAPRFFLTEAPHWDSGRILATWRYRWASEICHEFGQQVTGLEAAQGRQEEAVTRHFSA
jgi:hypothetical protein